MGLLRASLIFLIGNFSISLINNKLDLIDNVPVLGQFFGKDIKDKINKNKCLTLLLILTIVEFIL